MTLERKGGRPSVKREVGMIEKDLPVEVELHRKDGPIY